MVQARLFCCVLPEEAQLSTQRPSLVESSCFSSLEILENRKSDGNLQKLDITQMSVCFFSSGNVFLESLLVCSTALLKRHSDVLI